jgi:hypothetical protein
MNTKPSEQFKTIIEKWYKHEQYEINKTETQINFCNIQHLEIYEEQEGQLYLLCSFSREIILEQGLQTRMNTKPSEQFKTIIEKWYKHEQYDILFSKGCKIPIIFYLIL